MRFRLFRSLTFLLGLPGLIFLLWAWADSFDWQSQLSYSGKPGLGTLTSDGSTIFFDWTRYEPLRPGAGNPEYERPQLPTVSEVDFARDASSRAKRPLLWAKLTISTYRLGPMVTSHVFIPYWMIVLAYLGLWSAAMVWRWMRARRRSKVDPPRLGLELPEQGAPANPAH